jgi:hypothetical protein
MSSFPFWFLVYFAKYLIYPENFFPENRAVLVSQTTWVNGCGIFTSISGTAPNRIFNIE